MTLRDWLDVYTHNGDAQFVCAWRKRAWRAMRPIVEQFVADRDAGRPVRVGNLFVEIDAAGARERINLTGKRWIQERAKLLTIVQVQRELWTPPSADEYSVCLVARDLEEEGRLDEARRLLAEQAPNVLSRPCPACGQPRGQACVMFTLHGAYQPIVVPHEARVAA